MRGVLWCVYTQSDIVIPGMRYARCTQIIEKQGNIYILSQITPTKLSRPNPFTYNLKKR
jgi:hypothetical protein